MASIEDSFREVVEGEAERQGIFNRVIGIGDSYFIESDNRFLFIVEIEFDGTERIMVM
jgi:hypothetical protein